MNTLQLWTLIALVAIVAGVLAAIVWAARDPRGVARRRAVNEMHIDADMVMDHDAVVVRPTVSDWRDPLERWPHSGDQ